MNSPYNLKFRHELKYYVNYAQYLTIRQRLRNLISQDANASEQGEYHIRSLYFDDIDNKALHEKLGGVRDREKYRIRIYNKSDKTIHLEKKIKFNDYISKVKASLTREECDRLIAGDYSVLEGSTHPLKKEVRDEMKYHLLKPVVIVDYVREAYVCQQGNVRITFDKNLRTGLNSVDLFSEELPTVRAYDDEYFLLEVKYDEYFPEYIRQAIQMEGLIRQSNSKYVICRKLLKFNTWEDQ
ncbi:polyphosphate polymerase domain-containing protein [Cohnella fermenti]|uniref:Polyphosphate polymerase domain-containing protein n=1 Tax=Cohnella fermenti TaxID=2565925 RepID=A0A4S4BXX3_9BACL|nr:polyphosphate polymerase domain-containing protein [Cohnella fermenti]